MDFSVEAKYPLTIFKDNNLSYSWETIKVGWDLKRLTINELSKFAVKYLELHPDVVNEYISDLILGVKEYEVDNYLSKISSSLNIKFFEKFSPKWNIEWRKWRYCILSEMVKHVQDKEKLLTNVEGVYADFDYPEDMRSFIYYLPNKDTQGLSVELARKVLIEKIHKFLKEERNRIDSECDVLPKIMKS